MGGAPAEVVRVVGGPSGARVERSAEDSEPQGAKPATVGSVCEHQGLPGDLVGMLELLGREHDVSSSRQRTASAHSTVA